MQWASVLFVVCLVLRNADGAVISNYSLYGANISSACASAPAWKLNLCNLTCATCVASNPDLCSTCDANYVYDSSYCYTSDLYNFYYFTSLLTSPVIPLSEANMLIMGITGSPLLSDRGLPHAGCAAGQLAAELRQAGGDLRRAPARLGKRAGAVSGTEFVFIDDIT